MRLHLGFLLPLLLSGLLFSYPDGLLDYNKPHEKWYRSSTAHFDVLYRSGLKEMAEITATVAEEIHGYYVEKYGFVLPRKLNLIIYDEDYSNGWAWPSGNSVKIWIGGADFELRGFHHWLRDVVVHEMGHIVSMQIGQKTRYNIPDIRLGYFDYFNERTQTGFFTAYSFEIFPQWFAEGIAQLESSKKGSDSWDSHRDMLMRVKSLNDKILPPEQMAFFMGRGADMESGPYNQGFALVRYIDSAFGPGAVKRICLECQRPLTLSFGMAVKAALGISQDSLYRQWTDYEKAKYTRVREALGPLTEGARLMKDSSVDMGFRNLHPRWAHDKKKLFFLSSGPKDGGRAALSLYDFSDTIKEEKERYQTHYPGVTGFFTLTDSGKRVTSAGPTPDMIRADIYNDVFTDSVPEDKFLDNLKLGFSPTRKVEGRRVSKIRTRHTFRDHAMQAAMAHGGDRIVMVRKDKEQHRLVLIDTGNVAEGSLANLFTDFFLNYGRLSSYGRNPEKILFQGPADNKEGFLLNTPRFSPNDSLIVFSYFDGGSLNLGLVDTAGCFRPILATPADERDPDFSPDGRFVYFASDESGIFNIYRMELETGKIDRMTRVAGGAFCPAVSPDDSSIAYSNYDTSGFSIYVTANKAIEAPAYPLTPESPPTRIADPVNLSDARRYFPTLSRVLFSPMVIAEELTADNRSATSGKLGIKAGGLLSLSDPLDKNWLMLMGLMEIDKGIDYIGPDHGKHLFFNPAFDKDLLVLFENRSFYPTLSLEIDKFLIHQDDLFYNTVKYAYERDNYVIDVQRYSAAARFQLFSPLRKLHFSFTHSRQNIDFYDLAPNFALEYTFFKELNPSVFWTFLRMDGEEVWRQEDYIDTRGTYFKLKWDLYSDSILADGATWQESFEIGAGGVLHPKYRGSSHQRLRLDLRHARGLPVVPLLTGGFEAQASVADRPTDNFVYPGLFMKSIPYLLDQSHLSFQGRNAARGELFVRFPIMRRLRQGAGIFLFDKIYGMAFVEGGLSGGIDPREDGRQDLDPYSRGDRKVEAYVHLKTVNADTTRARDRSATWEEMERKIALQNAGKPGFVYDERDKHVVYESLPEDTVQGFWPNFKTLIDRPLRAGFGLELRVEGYITPGYPLFITARYSQELDRNDPAASFKRYFTGNPFNNPNGVFYLNAGFSFDGWEMIDLPEALSPAKRWRR